MYHYLHYCLVGTLFCFPLGVSLGETHAQGNQDRSFDTVLKHALCEAMDVIGVPVIETMETSPRGEQAVVDLRLAVTPRSDLVAIARALGKGTRFESEILETLKREVAASVQTNGPDQTVEISLKVFMPEFPRNNTGKSPGCDGPNCFNATLLYDRSSNAGPKIAYVAPEFMSSELGNALLFRKLGPTEKPRIHDVVAIRADQGYFRKTPGDLIHTARYVSPGYVWQKDSIHSGSWRFRTLSQSIGNAIKIINGEARVRIEYYRPVSSER